MLYVYEKNHDGTVKTWSAATESELRRTLAVVAAFKDFEISEHSTLQEMLAAGRSINAKFEIMEGLAGLRAALALGEVCDMGRFRLLRLATRQTDVKVRRDPTNAARPQL